jgi:hypothetical protein
MVRPFDDLWRATVTDEMQPSQGGDRSYEPPAIRSLGPLGESTRGLDGTAVDNPDDAT